jgi:hypothetical protein
MTIDRNCTVALRNAEAGLHIFPCSPATKRPSIHSWRKNSTTDPATIENWWRSRANHLVGIDLHKAGLLVLDGDRHPDENGEIIHDGVDAIRNLLEANGSNAWSNPVVWTPGGGVHIYFRCAAGGFGNAAGNLPDGIDVRGSGGYTIAPGCVLPDRRRYAPAERHPDLAASFRSIPELPGWLAEIIKPKPIPATAAPIPTHQSGRRFENYAAAALNGKARRLAAMPAETGRNNALNLMAWQMGTMANRGWINRATVEQALFTAAQTLVRDTGPRKVRMTIASGFNAGLQHPHPDLAARR